MRHVPINTSFQTELPAASTMPLTTNDAIIIFAKTPEPGAVKTRLAPMLGEERAARLYAAFIQDTLAACEVVEVDLRLYTAGAPNSFPNELIPPGATLHGQEGDGLGARMERAFSATFGEGYERAVIVGTDYPMLGPAVIRQAFEILGAEGGRKVPIGPSADGGYYMLGLSSPFPDIFEMTYSHPDVAADTIRRINRGGRVPVLLPKGYDIDRPRDLRRLIGDLRSDSERAPRSFHALEELGLLRDAPAEIEFSTD